MASNPHSTTQMVRPDLHLLDISVFLMNPGTAPSLINPDFLLHNGIVEPAWSVMRPVVMQANFSRIRYANGLSLFATDSHVVIAQGAATNPETTTITPLDTDDLVCFGVAKRYLNSVSPSTPFEMFTIDPNVFMDVPATDLNPSWSPLQRMGRRISFRGVVPEVHARAQYDLGDKEITIFASEIMPQGTDDSIRLHFGGEILRNVEEDGIQEQVELIHRLLDRWQDDISDFNELVYNFYSMYIQAEN
jgi:hypothetical protein